MNITQLLAGLIIINLFFSLSTTYTTGDLQSLLDDFGTSVNANKTTTENNLVNGEDNGQGFFMQEPTDASQNWLESMIRFGLIFAYFIALLTSTTIFVNLSILSTGTPITQFAQIMLLLGVLLINFMLIRGIYELLRKG